MAGQLVEGVGDEVVLFAAFLVLSVCLLVFVSLRGNRNRQRGRADERGERTEPEAASTPPPPLVGSIGGEGESVVGGSDVAEEGPAGESSSGGPGQPQSEESSSGGLGQPQSEESSSGGAGQPQSEELSSGGPGQLQSEESSGGSEWPQSEESSSGGPGQPQSEESSSGGPGQPQSEESSSGGSEWPQSGESSVRARFPQARADGGGEDSLSIRLILPSNSTLPVNVQRSTTIGDLRRAHFQEQLAERRPVRFIYQGRVLDSDAQTLQELAIGTLHAIHVHIGRPRPLGSEGTPNIGPRPPGEMLDISQLLLPLFGLIIAICWVSMFCFPDVFSLLSKFLLFLLSLVYVFMTFTMTRTNAAD